MDTWPDNWFDLFWFRYPRKVGKLAAHTALVKMRQRGLITDFDQLIKSVDEFRLSVRGKEVQYIPHPTTWINRGSWMDEAEEKQDDTAWKLDRAMQETMRRRMQ